MPLSEPHYQAYLLRCWQEPPAQPGDPPSAWRFALESVGQEPERRGFNSLEAVFAFLRAALENLPACLDPLYSHQELVKGGYDEDLP